MTRILASVRVVADTLAKYLHPCRLQRAGSA